MIFGAVNQKLAHQAIKDSFATLKTQLKQLGYYKAYSIVTLAEHATTLIDAWAENCHGAPICPTCSKPLRSRPRKHTRQWRQQHLQEATQ